jgi:hypothetical protein
MKKVFIGIMLMATVVFAQDTRRASGRSAPGPTYTPTPAPTPTPEIPAVSCAYVASPWGVACDVRDVCKFAIMPMHIGTPSPLRMLIRTDNTVTDVWKTVPGKGMIEIDWESPVRWAEFYVDVTEPPIFGCYCNERESLIVICAAGKLDRVIKK